MDQFLDNGIAALIFSIPVVIFNSIIAYLGSKNIDPTTDMRYFKMVSTPASIFEIIFLIWGVIYLPTKFMIAILLLPIVAMIFKTLKIDGSKFLMFVLVPITENVIIIYSLTHFWR